MKDPRDYPWSGHRTYLGEETIPWLTTEWVLGQFSRRTTGARQSYRRFIQAGLGEGYREDFHRGAEDARVLGDDDFLEKAYRQVVAKALKPPTLTRVIRAVCKD